MNDFAIVFSTSEAYLPQALAMYEQLRGYGLEKYAWVVPLDPLSSLQLDRLQAHFGDRVTQPLELPANVKRSGNKIFLPNAIPDCKQYILIDTDILILEGKFLDTFLESPRDRITLVEDSFTWQDWLSLASLSDRAKFAPEVQHLMNRPYIQTGSISISHQVHQNIFADFVRDLVEESHTYRGDLVIWNDWANRFPELFNFIPAHICLILRPDASGPSSTLHLPNLSYKEEILRYFDSPIASLHFTVSQGNVTRWQDYEPLLTRIRDRH